MATQAAENVALSQLQFEQAELLNTIDRLPELGVRHPVSRFKAVIEPSLSRTVEVRNRLQAFSLRLFTSEKDLWCVYEEVSKYLQSTGTVAIDDILRIEICGPDKPNVTIVDLPALHLSPTSDGDTKQDLSVARQTVERYMGNPNSILLAVANASNLPKTLRTAEKFDLNLERTIGIIVHPDVLETSSDDEDKCLQLLEDGRAKLPLGWHAISTTVEEDSAGNASGQVSGKLHVGKGLSFPKRLWDLKAFDDARRNIKRATSQAHEDGMQAYYDSAMMVFTENIATLAIENCLMLPLETIFSSKLVCGMGQEQIQRIVSEPASFDNGRQALRLEIDALEACLGTCRRYIKPVNLLKHKLSKGKLTSSSPTSVLSVSPDLDRPAQAKAPQKRQMEETPTGSMRPQQRARLESHGDLSVSPMPMYGGNPASQTNQSGFESYSGTSGNSPLKSFFDLAFAASPTPKDGQEASPPSTVGFDFHRQAPNYKYVFTSSMGLMIRSISFLSPHYLPQD
ncbi:hypothetical protein BJX62DRAFT_239825 [Aspergillus germanicus]